jgi:hypothetical protein
LGKRAATKGFSPRRLLSRGISRLKDRMHRNERVLRRFSRKIDGYSCSDVLVRRTVHGQSILLSGHDVSITPEIYMNGFYELREAMFLKTILMGGDYFVDVGANVGHARSDGSRGSWSVRAGVLLRAQSRRCRFVAKLKLDADFVVHGCRRWNRRR